MIKISLILSLVLIAGCSKSINPTVQKDDRNLLLANIKKGNLSSLVFEPNNLDIFTLGDDSVDLMVKRRRLEFPTFSTIHLFSAMAFDEKFQYSIFYSHEKERCILFVNDREALKRAGECYSAFNKCVAEKKINDWDEDLIAKCTELPICKNQSPLDRGTEIENDYCFMVYGK